MVAFVDHFPDWTRFRRKQEIESILEEAERDPLIEEQAQDRIWHIATQAIEDRSIPISKIPAGYRGGRTWEPAKRVDGYIEQIVDVVQYGDPTDLLRLLRESEQSYAVKDWSIMGRSGPDFWLDQHPIVWQPSTQFLKRIGYVDIDVRRPKNTGTTRRLILTRAGKEGKYDEYLSL